MSMWEHFRIWLDSMIYAVGLVVLTLVLLSPFVEWITISVSVD